MKKQNKSYKSYYLDTIQERIDNLKGIKYVLGGTGLGKTFGIKETIKHFSSSEDGSPIKFIYITNRHNLITEQEAGLAESEIPTAYLKSNTDLLLDLDKKEGGIPEIIKKLTSLNFFKYDADSKIKREIKLDKIISNIRFSVKMLENKDIPQENKDNIQKDLNFNCSEFYNILKTQLKEIHKRSSNFHKELMINECIWELFPYVKFEHDTTCNVLLVTIHKVLMGFFDGKKDIKLSSIKNKVIFMDEFDFLEKDVLKILCNEPSISNPFEFVKIFYQKYKHLSTQDFWNEENNYLKKRLDSVIKYIDNYINKQKINFFDIEDFKNKKGEHNSPKVLFHTNKTYIPDFFYLKEYKNTWYIENEKDKQSIKPSILFVMLAITTNKIIAAFNSVSNQKNLINGAIQEIWNPKNDNKAGEYAKFIKNSLEHYRDIREYDDFLLDKEKSPYEIGYRFIRLLKPNEFLDEKSVELNQIELMATPENMIAKLSDQNLIFALSATGDFERRLNCFFLPWLKKNTLYIEPSEDDKELVKALRDEKGKIRNSEVNLSMLQELDDEKHEKICNLLENLCNLEVFGENYNDDNYRKNRVSKTLYSINHCLDSDKHSQLLFLTTYKQIEYLLNYIIKEKIDEIPISVEKEENKSFSYYTITWNERTCNLILMNAELAKKLNTNENYINDYKEIFLLDKTIVITQYNSASNGINLPCYDKEGNATDFRGLHLIEENHFWFDDSDKEEDYKTVEKQALWRLWELYNNEEDNRQISKYQFDNELKKRSKLDQNKPDIASFNRVYKDTTDKTLNAIALYHQVIGRIERKRHEIKEIDILMDVAVFSDFKKYLTEYDSDFITERDEFYTSSLILQIQEKVKKHMVQLDLINTFNRGKSIKSENEISENIIYSLLNQIQHLNNNQLSEKESNDVKKTWEEIRENVLKHDFESVIKRDYYEEYIEMRSLCFKNKLVNRSKKIILNNMKLYKEHTEYKPYHLDMIYKNVNNDVIKNYFKTNEYKLEFDSEDLERNNTLFTPYIMQAILQGVIGEKAITALLLHHGISLEDNLNISDELYEVIDAKVKDIPIYFDFKNFSDNTMDLFGNPPDSLEYNEELNSDAFVKKLVNKYQILKKKNKDAILYVVNFRSNNKREANYFDENGKPMINENNSCIRVIPNVLNPHEPQETNHFFNQIINTINKYDEKK